MKKKTLIHIVPAILTTILLAGCKTKTLVDITASCNKAFKVGNIITKNDVKVTASYSDKSSLDTNEWTCNDFVNDSYTFKSEDAGEKEFVIKFNDKSTTLKVTVAPKEQYTVSFEFDDGSKISSISVFEGDKITRPTDTPTKAGYIFDDWYTSANGLEKFDFDKTIINKNTTIYAHMLKEVTFTKELDHGSYYYQYTQSGTIAKGCKFRFTATRDSAGPNFTWFGATNENYYSQEPGELYYDVSTKEGKLICVTNISKYDNATKNTTPLVENNGFVIYHYSGGNCDGIYFNKTSFNTDDKVIIDCIVTNDIKDNGVWFYICQ